MRGWLTWKLMVLAVSVTAIAPLRADPAIPPPSPEQLALVDQIQGLGPFKFGATLDSFDKDSLKVPEENHSSDKVTFDYVRTDQFGKLITWGTLQPTKVELQFYDNHLVVIRLL